MLERNNFYEILFKMEQFRTERDDDFQKSLGAGGVGGHQPHQFGWENAESPSSGALGLVPIFPANVTGTRQFLKDNNFPSFRCRQERPVDTEIHIRL